MPNTFYQEGHLYLARISYKLEAFIPSNYQRDVKLSDKLSITIRESPALIQEVQKKDTKMMLSCGCFSKGNCTLYATFNKNGFMPEEITQVSLQLDNSQSGMNIDSLTFALKQVIDISNGTAQINKKRIVKITRMQGVKAGKSTGIEPIAFTLPDTIQQDNYRKAKSVGFMHYLQGLKDSEKILNFTTKSKYISAQYFLEASAEVGDKCAMPPSVSCPIQIYCPDIQVSQLEAPPNWNPVEIERVNLAFAPGDQYKDYDAFLAKRNDMINVAMIGDNHNNNGYQPPQQYDQYKGY